MIRSSRKYYLQLRYGKPVQVMNKDWDNLILLDACRFDYYKNNCNIKAELRPVMSTASHSWEFMKKNFVGEEYHNTVYVTANPFSSRISDNTFYKIVNCLEDWDSDLETVPPEKVVERAIAAHREFPNKKLVIHFMQPHDPFIGLKAQNYFTKDRYSGFSRDPKSKDKNRLTHLEAAQEGHISEDQLRTFYIENLELCLEYVKYLTKEINGLTIISSDHGEMLGESVLPHRDMYTHKPNIYTSELRVVPWHIVDSDERRSTISETPIRDTKINSDEVQKHLKSLGYLNS